MSETVRLSNFASIANAVFNSVTANATAVTAMTVGGAVINSTSLSAVTNTFTVGTAAYFVANGNLGINETNPQARLHVQRTGPDFSPTFDAATTAAFVSGGVSGSGSAVAIVSGNTGVASLYFGDTEDPSIGRVFYDNSTNALRVNVNGSERMRIDSSGNVGIGNTAPNARLTVTGAANISGNVAVGGTLSVGGASVATTGRAVAMAIVFGG